MYITKVVLLSTSHVMYSIANSSLCVMAESGLFTMDQRDELPNMFMKKVGMNVV